MVARVCRLLWGVGLINRDTDLLGIAVIENASGLWRNHGLGGYIGGLGGCSDRLRKRFSEFIGRFNRLSGCCNGLLLYESVN